MIDQTQSGQQQESGDKSRNIKTANTTTTFDQMFRRLKLVLHRHAKQKFTNRLILFLVRDMKSNTTAIIVTTTHLIVSDSTVKH